MDQGTAGRDVLYNVDELTNRLSSFNLVGRTIVSIDIIGRAPSICLETMRDIYQQIQTDQNLFKKYNGKIPVIDRTASSKELEEHQAAFLNAARMVKRPIRVHRSDIPLNHVLNRF